MEVRVQTLGAGRDVGKSCILVHFGTMSVVMLDCGIHMGDRNRHPDFSLVPRDRDGSLRLDAVFISHLHLDHVGSLPMLTEKIGYKGNIIMSQPTKALSPILLRDYVSINRRQKSSTPYDEEDVRNCMKKVRTIGMGETISISQELELTGFYAGHVVGALMCLVRHKYTGITVLYTGDFNMRADRHMGPARLPSHSPLIRGGIDVLITETTYGGVIRSPKAVREKFFFKHMMEALKRGGKVLVPVFAVGRVQEMVILCENYWERMGLAHIPLLYSAGLASKISEYYKLFIQWTNKKIQDNFLEENKNTFDFKYVRPFEYKMLSSLDSMGQFVLFASPGMLHGGVSLEAFKILAGDPLNLVILPGYCVRGTTGGILQENASELASGGRIDVKVDGKNVPVKCEVRSLSFSAHSDAWGINQMLQRLSPKNLVLVHGEAMTMEFVKDHVGRGFPNMQCFSPANNGHCLIKCAFEQTARVHKSLLGLNGTTKLNGVLVCNSTPTPYMKSVFVTNSDLYQKHALKISKPDAFFVYRTKLSSSKIGAQRADIKMEDEEDANLSFSSRLEDVMSIMKGDFMQKQLLQHPLEFESDTFELFRRLVERIRGYHECNFVYRRKNVLEDENSSVHIVLEPRDGGESVTEFMKKGDPLKDTELDISVRWRLEDYNVALHVCSLLSAINIEL